MGDERVPTGSTGLTPEQRLEAPTIHLIDAGIATEIFREAGASYVHRSDSPPTALHVHSTMRMGKVVDEAREAYDVDRVFVADHSALANGIGGTNPTNTGQALAARTGEKIVERCF